MMLSVVAVWPLLIQLAGPALPTDVIRRPNYSSASPVASFDVPDEIAPAILPYFACLLASAGTPIRTRAGLRDPSVPVFVRNADCTPYRKGASSGAEKLLKQQKLHGRKKERRAFIEATLLDAEAFAARSKVPEGQ